MSEPLRSGSSCSQLVGSEWNLRVLFLWEVLCVQDWAFHVSPGLGAWGAAGVSAHWGLDPLEHKDRLVLVCLFP